jgi:hypothetical protein
VTISLNAINLVEFENEILCAFCEVGTEVINIVYINFRLKRVNLLISRLGLPIFFVNYIISQQLNLLLCYAIYGM